MISPDNKIKKFIDDFQIFESEFEFIKKTVEEARELMDDPSYRRVIPREAGRLYDDALNRCMNFIGKIGVFVGDITPEEMRTDMEEFKREKLEMKKEEEQKKKEEIDAELMKIQPRDEIIELPEEEQKKIYDEITFYRDKGKMAGIKKGWWVRKHNRITIDNIMKKFEGDPIIKDMEDIVDGNNSPSSNLQDGKDIKGDV